MKQLKTYKETDERKKAREEARSASTKPQILTSKIIKE